MSTSTNTTHARVTKAAPRSAASPAYYLGRPARMWVDATAGTGRLAKPKHVARSQ